MGEVVKLTPKINPEKEFHIGWICGCGGQEWNLFADGKCVCTSCECYSTVIKVIEADPNAPA